MDDREFSAIYESIEDSGSDPDEYVAVSHPDSDPGPYLLPEPAMPAPRPPKTPPPSHVTTPTGGGQSWMNPLPLPRKPPSREIPGRKQPQLQPGAQHDPPPQQRAPSLKKLKPKPPPKYHLLPEMKGTSPTNPIPRPRTPAPAYRPPPSARKDYQDHRLKGVQPGGGGGGSYSPTLPPPNPQPGYQSNTNKEEGGEEEAEYESIKETRRMIAARKKYLQKMKAKKQREEEAASRWGGGGEGGEQGGGGGGGWGQAGGGGGGGGWGQAGGGGEGEQIKMKTLPQNLDSSDSTEEILLGLTQKSSKRRSKVVCIMLSITMVSLLIAVSSLAIALYTVGARGKPMCSTTNYSVHINNTTKLVRTEPYNFSVSQSNAMQM